jgi:hypothetical protein
LEEKRPQDRKVIEWCPGKEATVTLLGIVIGAAIIKNERVIGCNSSIGVNRSGK